MACIVALLQQEGKAKHDRHEAVVVGGLALRQHMFTHSTLSALSEYSTRAVLLLLDSKAGGSGLAASFWPLSHTNLPKNHSQTGDTESQPTTSCSMIAQRDPKANAFQPNPMAMGKGAGGFVAGTPIDCVFCDCACDCACD